MRRAAALIPIAALAAVLALASCNRGTANAAPPARTVTVVRAGRASITVSLEYAARVRAKQEIVVSSKISGRVADVRADVAQAVRRGQVLFTLESRDLDAQSRQARAALQSAQANLTRTGDSSLSSQMIPAQAAVDQAQVQYNDASDLAGRMDKLFAQGSVSRQQRDDARARSDSAKISLDAAKQSLSLIQEKGGPQSTGVASSQVDQARASADLAQSQLDNTVITSPLTGVVASRSVDPGELVGSGTPAFVVMDMSSMTAEASVDEAMVRKIRPGEKVPVRADAADSAVMPGVVDTVSPAADPRTQGYAVKVRITRPDTALRPGMLARVSFPVESRSGVLAVPNQALVTESGAQYVYVDAEGVVKKVPVQIGISDDSITEVTGGLSDGDLVITEGQSFLNDGDRVTVAK